jgi:hypothetical protein
MLSRRLLWIPVCLLAAVFPDTAQQNLTLADATARALARNHAIRLEREGITAADARMTEALGEYDPQVRLDLTARHSRDPITSLFSGAPSGEVAPTANSFGSKPLRVAAVQVRRDCVGVDVGVARRHQQFVCLGLTPPTTPLLASTCGSLSTNLFVLTRQNDLAQAQLAEIKRSGASPIVLELCCSFCVRRSERSTAVRQNDRRNASKGEPCL